MKKVKLVLIGAISLVVFGVLLPQPIQALLVMVDTPIKQFFAIHTLSLCVIVGIIQGVSEECGYYFVLKQLSQHEQSERLPLWFGLGRSLLHTLYDMATIVAAFTTIRVFIFSVVSRMLCFAAMMGLTKIDYLSYQTKEARLLGLSVLLHAMLNGILYAYELQLFHAAANFDIWFMAAYSVAVAAISSILCRKE